MKPHKYIGLGWMVIGASLMVACADHKGFQARKATPEEIFKAKMAKMGQGLAVPGGEGPTSTGGDAVAVPARAENDGSLSVDFSDADRANVSDFAQVVHQQGLANNGGKTAHKDAAVKVDAKTPAEQKILVKLAEINKALSPEAVEIIKGITVTLKTTSSDATKAEDRRFVVTVDMLLAIGDKDVTASGGASLATQDQFKSSKIVEVRLNRVMDSLTKELKLKGVEVYATCSIETCETVKILVLITREDGKQVSMIGDFAADGAGRGTSLGNQLRTLQEAQDLRSTERAAKADGAGNQVVGKNQSAKPELAAGGQGTGDRNKSAGTDPSQKVDNKSEQQVIRHEGDETKIVEKRFPGIEDIALRADWEAKQKELKAQALQKIEDDRVAQERAAKRKEEMKASIERYFEKKEADHLAAKKVEAAKAKTEEQSWWDKDWKKIFSFENKRWTNEKKQPKPLGTEYDPAETLKYYQY